MDREAPEQGGLGAAGVTSASTGRDGGQGTAPADDKPRKEAAAIMDEYFAQFPAIKKYMTDTIAFARKNGYVETVTGRRLRMATTGAVRSCSSGCCYLCVSPQHSRSSRCSFA